MGPWSLDRSRPTSPAPSASSPISTKSSAKNIVKTSLIILEKAVDGLNIPGLKGAAGSIVELIKIAEKRQQNKEALDELVVYLRRLEDAMITPLLSKQSLGVSSDLESRVRRLVQELVTLAGTWKDLGRSHKRLLSFINHEDYSAEIVKLNKLIKDSLDAFSLESHIVATIVGESTHHAVVQIAKDQVNIHQGVRHLLSKEIHALPHAKASYDSISRNNAPTCFEGTRVKVFEDIGNWTNAKGGPNGYVMVGVAGVGKTTVAQTLAEREAKIGRLAATYFFSRDENERSKADLFFCTIAYQLAQRSKQFADRIGAALQSSPDAPEKTLAEQLQKLIVEPLQDLHPSDSHPTLIVIDALDECEEQGASEILQLILDQLPFFKVLITTRPEPHVITILSSHDRHQRLILHEVDNAIVEGDIRKYLDHQLSETEVRREIPGCTWRLEKKDLDALVEAAGRLFVIASTANKFIKDKIQRDPQHQLKVLLGGLEMGDDSDLSPHAMLDRVYSQVLDTAIPQSHSTRNIIQRFQSVVGTIVVLRNPLSPQSLADLLEMDTSAVNAVIDRLQSVIISNKEDKRPRVYHPSFPDFITNSRRCKDARYLIELPKHHGRLAAHCFNTMKRMLKRNICGTPLPNQYLENSEIPGLASAIEKHIPPELVYACCYWAIHLSKAPPGVEGLHSQLEAFAFEHLLFWLEVLSLTGNLKWAHSSLMLAQKFMPSQGGPVGLLSMLIDGQRFIMASQEIIKLSSLHLYYSALPFTPSQTSLFQTYKEHTKHSVRALQGQMSNWDPLLAVLAGHTDHVFAVAFTSDGLRLASGSKDKTVRMWDGLTGTHKMTLEGHSEWVWCLAFTSDGRYLASGSKDMTVRLWDGRTGASISTLKGHTGWVKCVAFTSDGERLASGSTDETITLWDCVAGTWIATLKGHSGPVNSVAFAPNGQLASASNDNTIILWNISAATPLATLQAHSARVRSVVFSSDGKRIASGSNDKTTKFWNVETHALLITLNGHSENVISVAFSPDGTRLASGSWDQTVRLWDGVTGEHQVTLKGHSAGIYSIAFSPDGSHLASGSGDNTVRLWDCPTETSTDIQQAHSDWVYDLAVTSDGLRLASASLDKTIKLWDVTTGALITTLHGHSSRVHSVTFSNDGTRLVSSSNDKEVRLWDGVDGALILTLLSHSGGVHTTAFTPDGEIIASGSRDCTIKLWSSATGVLIKTFNGHSGSIQCLAFTPDGNHLASGSDDNTVIVWDVSAATPTITLSGHSDKVRCVAFTSSGEHIASGSDDKTIRLWDRATGAHLTTLEGHLAPLVTVAFIPDDTSLVSSSYDGDRRLWNISEIIQVDKDDTQLDQVDDIVPSATSTAPHSTNPVQLLKKNNVHVVLASHRSPATQIPIFLLPTGSDVWSVVSTTNRIAIALRSGQLFILDSSQVRLG